MSEQPELICPECNESNLKKTISSDFYVAQNYKAKGTIQDHKESEHKKFVKDPERAIKLRKKAFGHDEVGDPRMASDPKHIVKRGRVLDGQNTEVDKKEFIRAAAKDPLLVKKATDALKQARANST